ncbi:cytochrome c oxidase accessory protein CcoG [Vogesella oryzae]|uniref:cytochrome c oxidase accessory protein CcoG n=1 Tax=Vogesella oryzae TaxID=1735285 RepID=UPI0015842C91|nr:cytochrome c oxidase accessory protein CcoG [Vogesella oryzae]
MAIPIHFVSGKVYPRLTGGRFNNWRIAFVIVTQLLYFGLPWLQWNGHQAVRYDFASMRGYLFGLTLLPQDLTYLAGTLIIAALGLFLWTMLAGRLWCGFSCPQTVYSQIMLWLERLLEGPPNARRKLDAAPWGAEKLLKKGGTQSLMLLFSLLTGLTLVGYFTPMRELAANLAAGHIGPWESLFALGYAAFTWLLAGHLREQVCKHMCPYARFQGAMFDDHTLLVAYDSARGEPRGARRKEAANVAAQGDCVDCGLCVQVCPTGIDIRNGLQYECIGCGLCADACDGVMDKLAAPRGLIRLTTQHALQHAPAPRAWQRPRALLYGGLIATLTLAMLVSLWLRQPFRVDILRDRAVMARENADGNIENAYALRIFNTLPQARQYRLVVSGEGVVAAQPDTLLQVPADGDRSFIVTVAGDPNVLARGSHPITFELQDAANPQQQVSEETRLLMP